MDKCICNRCNHLKSIIEEGKASQYSCEFGFPSDNCNACDEEACSETCSNYADDDEEVVEFRAVNCKVCGKQLEKVMDEDTDGEVYCIECYLKMD